MVYFVLLLLVVLGLVGGLYYGFSYLRAKATKKKVADVIVEDVNSKIAPKP